MTVGKAKFKVKQYLVQTWRGSEGSRRLRLPDLMKISTLM
jgi:hypothetical protein